MEAGSESAFRAELSNTASVAGGHERVPVGREWEMQHSPRLPGRCLRSQSALAHLLVLKYYRTSMRGASESSSIFEQVIGRYTHFLFV